MASGIAPSELRAMSGDELDLLLELLRDR